MNKLIYTIILLLACAPFYACNTNPLSPTLLQQENNPLNQETMKLKITVEEKTATAVLYDNASSRDFASLLPLTLELSDYANTEKVATLAKALSTQGAPKGYDPSVGDIAYYAPWGNICVFYKDFGYANGLVPLGKIITGMENFTVKGTVSVSIELEQ